MSLICICCTAYRLFRQYNLPTKKIVNFNTNISHGTYLTGPQFFFKKKLARLNRTSIYICTWFHCLVLLMTIIFIGLSRAALRVLWHHAKQKLLENHQFTFPGHSSQTFLFSLIMVKLTHLGLIVTIYQQQEDRDHLLISRYPDGPSCDSVCEFFSPWHFFFPFLPKTNLSFFDLLCTHHVTYYIISCPPNQLTEVKNIISRSTSCECDYIYRDKLAAGPTPALMSDPCTNAAKVQSSWKILNPQMFLGWSSNVYPRLI